MAVRPKTHNGRRAVRRPPEDDDESEKNERPRLRAETKHGIAVVFFFTLGAVCALSLLGLAGGMGEAIKHGLRSLFGMPTVLAPVVVLLIGYALAKPQKYSIRFSHGVGMVLFLISFTGMFHLFIPLDEATSVIGEARGGGYFGLALSYPLQKILGPWATGIILLGVFIVSLLLVFDTSLPTLVERGTLIQRLARRFKEFLMRLRNNMNVRSEDDEDEDSDEPSFTRQQISQATAPSAGEAPEARGPSVASATSSSSQLDMFPQIRRTRRKISIPLELLEEVGTKAVSGDIEANKERIHSTLSNFGIPVEMGEVNVGPTVTQYTLKPAEGVKLSQLTTLSNDLALALAAHPIRIEAPIPGKSLVGIEVPNTSTAIVRLRQVLASQDFKKRKGNLSVALGLDVAGNPWIADLDAMPHLLIAGSTGSGKSVCINTIILSLMYQCSPDDLKLILVDPKRVEMPVYNNIPYLLTPVVTQVDKTINALRWVVGEMDRRFDVLSKAGKRNIHEYNASPINERMPFIVVVIDELADLMAVAMREVEAAIIRLAQMARAVGIHLVVATQRPSVDVITGLIKANITSRIAFTVASVVDSRTILDSSGAEKLLGKGDMLYVTAQLSKPRRLQGVYVTNEEIERVANFVREQGKPDYHPEVVEKLVIDETLSGGFEDLGDDELLAQAKDLVVKAGKASASLLQRRLRVGYARAARLLDLLEEQGVIGPGDGAKPREILMSSRPMDAMTDEESESVEEEGDDAEEGVTEESEDQETTEEKDETPDEGNERYG